MPKKASSRYAQPVPLPAPALLPHVPVPALLPAMLPAPLPLIVKGKTSNGVSVTIVGEIHNQINQSFYENLYLTLGKKSNKSLLWVEHSTVFCELDMYIDANAKGSEWIWLTSQRTGRPVTCIDIRIEYGFLSRIEEIEIRETIRYASVITTINVLLAATKKTLQALVKVIDLIRPIRPVLDNVTDELKLQCKELIKYLDPEFDQVPLFLAVYGNLVTVGSMVLDAFLLHELEAATKKNPIYLFVGLNHAFRLAKWLDWEIKDERYQELRESALRHF